MICFCITFWKISLIYILLCNFYANGYLVSTIDWSKINKSSHVCITHVNARIAECKNYSYKNYRILCEITRNFVITCWQKYDYTSYYPLGNIWEVQKHHWLLYQLVRVNKYCLYNHQRFFFHHHRFLASFILAKMQKFSIEMKEDPILSTEMKSS